MLFCSFYISHCNLKNKNKTKETESNPRERNPLPTVPAAVNAALSSQKRGTWEEKNTKTAPVSWPSSVNVCVFWY